MFFLQLGQFLWQYYLKAQRSQTFNVGFRFFEYFYDIFNCSKNP